MSSSGGFVVGLLAVALLAPLLANDQPLVAVAGDRAHFPAFATYLGERSTAPDGRPWKTWWALLDEDSPDWALMPPWPYGPLETDTDLINARPTLAHPLGNDYVGRDVLSQLVHGASTTMLVALGAVLLAALIGVPLGAFAGYRGGLADHLLSRLIEVFVCFPAFFMALAAVAFFGDSALAILLVLGLLFWTSFARIVRGELLSLRERPFVLAARGLGVSTPRVLRRHLLPEVRGPVLVMAAFAIASAVVVEATLSFLGLGPGASGASWGQLLQQGKSYAHTGAWHLWLFPGLAVVGTVWAFHSLADRVQRRREALRSRDALAEPR